jgi:hypothetical protein
MLKEIHPRSAARLDSIPVRAGRPYRPRLFFPRVVEVVVGYGIVVSQFPVSGIGSVAAHRLRSGAGDCGAWHGDGGHHNRNTATHGARFDLVRNRGQSSVYRACSKQGSRLPSGSNCGPGRAPRLHSRQEGRPARGCHCFFSWTDEHGSRSASQHRRTGGRAPWREWSSDSVSIPARQRQAKWVRALGPKRFAEENFLREYFREVRSERVIWNLPPAKVYTCRP